MQYTSTRDDRLAVESRTAIQLGMVPGGGLFVPASIPRLDLDELEGRSYREVALRVLGLLLADFSIEDLHDCVERAYRRAAFDVDTVVDLVPLGPRRHVMELWHGPTAAFKDVALQIMPGLLSKSKKMLGDGSHTVLLVATSGDTGKAALEGFKGGEGLSVIVFFPHGGVSEIQRLQMVTTEGSNVHVLAVRGNFDDCQTGVKQIFADEALGRELAGRGVTLSSANSINWGRLCPQIVYYFHAYLRLLELGRIERGEPIHVCVPTGNFGNILAGFYARAMGLPIDKLICASNRNKILADFFTTRIYDRNREFHRTTSPSMDILISSNLERFLFEVSGHDASRVRGWYAELSRTGRFEVDEAIGKAMGSLIVPGWVDEPRVAETIRRAFERFRYVVDPHTAVALAVVDALGLGLDPGEARGPRIGVDPRIELEDRHTVIDSTASAYKFSGDVLRGIAGEEAADEFESIARLHRISGVPIHRAVDGLRQKPVLHDRVIDVDGMKGATLEIIERLTAG